MDAAADDVAALIHLFAQPGLTKLLAAARRGDMDTVVVVDPYAFADSVPNAMVLEEVFARLGIAVEYAALPEPGTPERAQIEQERAIVNAYRRAKLVWETSASDRNGGDV